MFSAYYRRCKCIAGAICIDSMLRAVTMVKIQVKSQTIKTLTVPMTNRDNKDPVAMTNRDNKDLVGQ